MHFPLPSSAHVSKPPHNDRQICFQSLRIIIFTSLEYFSGLMRLGLGLSSYLTFSRLVFTVSCCVSRNSLRQIASFSARPERRQLRQVLKRRRRSYMLMIANNCNFKEFEYTSGAVIQRRLRIKISLRSVSTRKNVSQDVLYFILKQDGEMLFPCFSTKRIYNHGNNIRRLLIKSMSF